ncbi:CHAT domain-containing protein [Kitasatospora sp. NPDC094015]|uniref:CHAT domain-containing protein n=1 Tax=Kitasatospora sp. NPDC094015 TaxID=3155205 RepID=UPI0033339F1C
MRFVVVRVGPADGTGHPVEIFEDAMPTEQQGARPPRPRRSGRLPAAGSSQARWTAEDVESAKALLGGAGYDRDRARRTRDLLHSMLESTGAMAVWQEAVSTAEPTDPPVRTLIESHDPALADLPWELLQLLPDRRAGQPHRFRLSRAVEWPWPRPTVPLQRPLRVLVAVGSPEDQALRAEEEIEAIQSALRRHPGEWHVEVVRGPTGEQFFDRVEVLRPHVLHFIGHSGADLYDDVVLQFRPPCAPPWNLLGEQVALQFPPDSPPRLVVLNSCHSSPGALVGTGSSRVAEAFLRLGAGALVTMQGEVASDGAARFAGAFYRALAEEEPVDEALWQARRVVAQQPDGLDRPDPALPRLTLAALPDRILHREPGADRKQAAELFAVEETRLDLMVDRTAARRTLLGGPGWAQPLGPSGLTVVRGQAGTGKTVLVRSCLLSWHLNGGRTTHVDFTSQGRTLNWLDAVRHLCARVRVEVGDGSADPLDRFAHQLQHRRRGLEPPAGPPWQPDDLGPWEPEADAVWPGSAADRLFADLHEALRTIALPSRLTIVLDQLEGLEEGALAQRFGPLLLGPVRRDAAGPLALVVVEDSRAGERARLSEDLLRRTDQRIEVGPFAPDEAAHVFSEYRVAWSVRDEAGAADGRRRGRAEWIRRFGAMLDGTRAQLGPTMLLQAEHFADGMLDATQGEAP